MSSTSAFNNFHKETAVGAPVQMRWNIMPAVQSESPSDRIGDLQANHRSLQVENRLRGQPWDSGRTDVLNIIGPPRGKKRLQQITLLHTAHSPSRVIVHDLDALRGPARPPLEIVIDHKAQDSDP